MKWLEIGVEKEAPWLLDYVIVGGLVFVVLSQQYLRATFGEKWRKERCSGLAELIECRERHFADEQERHSAWVQAEARGNSSSRGEKL